MGKHRRKLSGVKLSLPSPHTLAACERPPKSNENAGRTAYRSEQLALKKERRKHLTIISFSCGILVALLYCAVYFLDHDGIYGLTVQPPRGASDIGPYRAYKGPWQHKTPTVEHRDTGPLAPIQMPLGEMKEQDGASSKSPSEWIEEMTHRLDSMATDMERLVECFRKQAEMLNQILEILNGETFRKSARVCELRSHQDQDSRDDPPQRI